MKQVSGLVSMDIEAVRRAYARWAPVYDVTFGLIADSGRRQAVDHINNRHGRVLEVGVGTGVTLPRYRRDLKISAIDLSVPMLDKARRRVSQQRLDNVETLAEMDAAELTFDSAYFDVVVAMYVMTVVPDPQKVMNELERVCAPGGEVIIVNHFSQDDGARGWAERRLAPMAEKLGWRPEFPIEEVMVCDRLRLVEQRALKPFGLFTMLRFVRQTERSADPLPRRKRRNITGVAPVRGEPLSDTL